MSHLISILFGQGTWGAGGNLVAWVICGIPAVLGGLWHHRRQVRAEFRRLHERIDELAKPAGSLGNSDTERAEPRDVPMGFSAPEARARPRP